MGSVRCSHPKLSRGHRKACRVGTIIIINIMKIKPLAMIGILALSFTFMSFSSGSSTAYGDAYAVNTSSASPEDTVEESFTAVGRLLVVASQRAVAFTRVACPQVLRIVDETVVQASTVVIADNVDKHSKEYIKSLAIMKDQKLRQLG